MPSLKRDRLLSDLERERLTNRSTEKDRHTRTTNDVRVKKKLAAWQSAISDVVLILQNLPEEQLQDVIDDWGIYFLLNIVENAMEIKKFYPIEGDADKPEEWKAIIKYDAKTEKKDTRSADDLDIARASMLAYHIGILAHYMGTNNPMPKINALATACKNPNLPDFGSKLADGERRALERSSQALKKFITETVHIEKEEPK